MKNHRQDIDKGHGMINLAGQLHDQKLIQQ